MQNTGLIMNDCQKFRNMKTRKVFPKKAFPPHCAKRHVNLEMGYSWYNTVIWAKRKSAPTLSKCVSQIWCLQGPISNTFPQIPSIYCCCWAVVYHVVCICILFMQGPLLCASTDYGVTDSKVDKSQPMKWRTFWNFWGFSVLYITANLALEGNWAVIIENEKSFLL